MRSKSELIDISKSFDTDCRFFSFYEFAVKYISNLKVKGITETDVFFSTIKKLGDNPNIKANFSAFGKQSKNSSEIIKPWCMMILGRRADVSDLDMDELHFVMGYCSRLAKIAEIK